MHPIILPIHLWHMHATPQRPMMEPRVTMIMIHHSSNHGGDKYRQGRKSSPDRLLMAFVDNRLFLSWNSSMFSDPFFEYRRRIIKDQLRWKRCSFGSCRDGGGTFTFFSSRRTLKHEMTYLFVEPFIACLFCIIFVSEFVAVMSYYHHSTKTR